MIRENNFYKLGRDALILVLSVSLVLFVQWIKLLKNPKNANYWRYVCRIRLIMAIFSYRNCN